MLPTFCWVGIIGGVYNRFTASRVKFDKNEYFERYQVSRIRPEHEDVVSRTGGDDDDTLDALSSSSARVSDRLLIRPVCILTPLLVLSPNRFYY